MSKKLKREVAPQLALDFHGTRTQSVHFSSKSDNWTTPAWLIEAVKREFPIDCDAASTDENCVVQTHFTKKDDGLVQDWGKGCIWLNPPYGRQIGKWVKKAYESAQAGATVVCLSPARTDTSWWHRWVMKGEVRYFLGRLRFGNAKNAALFPSVLVIFYPPSFYEKSISAKEGGAS